MLGLWNFVYVLTAITPRLSFEMGDPDLLSKVTEGKLWFPYNIFSTYIKQILKHLIIVQLIFESRLKFEISV